MRRQQEDDSGDWLFLGFLICITVTIAFVIVGLSLSDRHGIFGERIDEREHRGHQHHHDEEYQDYVWGHTTDHAQVATTSAPTSYAEVSSSGLLCNMTNVDCNNYQWYSASSDGTVIQGIPTNGGNSIVIFLHTMQGSGPLSFSQLPPLSSRKRSIPRFPFPTHSPTPKPTPAAYA